MKDHTKNLSPNTVAFSCLGESAATVIIDVILAMASVLKWRPSAKYLLIEILSRIAEVDSFECSHADFSAAIWSHLTESARKEKFSKWLAKIKEEMKLSLFPAVKIAPPRHKKTEDGQHIGLPTLYQRGAFWGLFRGAQEYALECDLLALPVRMRRVSIRAFAVKWLEKYGAVPIERTKKAEEVKPARPSLPCSCACANCQRCAAKPATASEADGAEPVLSVQIQNAKDRGLKIERDMVALGTDLLNLGNKISVVDSKLDALGKSARVQIKTALARKAGRGADYAPDTEARAHGRAALELAIDALKDAQAQAELIGKGKHGAKFEELWKALQQWRVFENRAEVSFEGGQPK